VAADFFFISMSGKLDMHGVHGRRWSACVGCEDKKMAAHLMKRSGATLIRDGGKAIGEKSEVEEAWAGSWILGVRGEEEEMKRSVDFWVDGRS
jgi:hypothetical protein